MVIACVILNYQQKIRTLVKLKRFHVHISCELLFV